MPNKTLKVWLEYDLKGENKKQVYEIIDIGLFYQINYQRILNSSFEGELYHYFGKNPIGYNKIKVDGTEFKMADWKTTYFNDFKMSLISMENTDEKIRVLKEQYRKLRDNGQISEDEYNLKVNLADKKKLPTDLLGRNKYQNKVRAFEDAVLKFYRSLPKNVFKVIFKKDGTKGFVQTTKQSLIRNFEEIIKQRRELENMYRGIAGDLTYDCRYDKYFDRYYFWPIMLTDEKCRNYDQNMLAFNQKLDAFVQLLIQILPYDRSYIAQNQAA